MGFRQAGYHETFGAYAETGLGPGTRSNQCVYLLRRASVTPANSAGVTAAQN